MLISNSSHFDIFRNKKCWFFCICSVLHNILNYRIVSNLISKKFIRCLSCYFFFKHCTVQKIKKAKYFEKLQGKKLVLEKRQGAFLTSKKEGCIATCKRSSRNSMIIIKKWSTFDNPNFANWRTPVFSAFLKCSFIAFPITTAYS